MAKSRLYEPCHAKCYFIIHLKKEEKAEKERDSLIIQRKDAEGAIQALENSVSFRVGRSFTYPGRKIRDYLKKK